MKQAQRKKDENERKMLEDIASIKAMQENAYSGKDDNNNNETFIKLNDTGDAKFDFEDVSVWDFPLGQSTPPREEHDRATQPPGGNRRSERVQNADKAKRVATERPKGAQKDKRGDDKNSASYKVDIVIAEEDVTLSDTSSSTDSDSPLNKKMKAGESGVSRPGRGSGRRGRGRARGRLTDHELSTIREEAAGRRAGNASSEEAWSDMDDGSPYDALTDEADTGCMAGTTRAERRRAEMGDAGEKDRSGKGNVKEAVMVSKQLQKRGGESKKVIVTEGENCSFVDSEGESSSYAEMANKNKWNTQGRKRKNVDTRHMSLKGKKTISHREVYVQGLDFQGLSDYADMEALVQKYCKKEGIAVVFIKIIPVKYDKSQVGCKLSVVEEDFERVVDDDFWPEFVNVRPWVYKPKPGMNAGVNDYGGQ